MANEIRRRYNFMSGIISDNPLSNSATTLNSTNLAGLPAVGSTEHVALVLDPTGVGNGPEIVWVTAHTGSATSATIVRAREGTSAVQHASTIAWVHVATTADFGTIGDDNDQPSSGGLPFEGEQYVDTTNDRVQHYSGSAWQRTAHYSSTGRTGGTWTRATNLAGGSGGEGTVITFTSETFDSDGFLAPTSGTVTIPSGLGGLYIAHISYTWASAPASFSTLVDINSTRWANIGGGYTTNFGQGLTVLLPVAAGDTVKFSALHQTGSSININPARLDFYRIAI